MKYIVSYNGKVEITAKSEEEAIGKVYDKLHGFGNFTIDTIEH